jgi:hypothetical protein
VNDCSSDRKIIITNKTTLETHSIIPLTAGGNYIYVFTYTHNSFIVTAIRANPCYQSMKVYLYTIIDDVITVNDVKHKSERNIIFTDTHTEDGIIADTMSLVSNEPLYAVIKFDANFEEVVVKQCIFSELEYVLYTKHGLLRVYNSDGKINLKLGDSTMELEYNDHHDKNYDMPEIKLVGGDYICVRLRSLSYPNRIFYSIKDGCFDVSNGVEVTIPRHLCIDEVLYYESAANILFNDACCKRNVLRFSNIPPHIDEVAKDESQFIAARDGKIYVHTREGNVKVI